MYDVYLLMIDIDTGRAMEVSGLGPHGLHSFEHISADGCLSWLHSQSPSCLTDALHSLSLGLD